MKKVIRLTESDLVRIVKRVINESETATTGGGGGGYTQNAKTAIGLLEKGMGGLGTDENMVSKGVYTIKTKQDYDHVLKHANAKGFKTIMAWIATDMSWQSQQDTHGQVKDFIGNNEYLINFRNHLEKFNPNEQIIK